MPRRVFPIPPHLLVCSRRRDGAGRASRQVTRLVARLVARQAVAGFVVRFVAGLVVGLVVLGGCGTATGTATATSGNPSRSSASPSPPPLPCASDLDDGAFAHCLEQALSRVWTGLFAATGREYRPPALDGPDTGHQPDGVGHRAYYEEDTQTIHVPAGYLVDLRAAFDGRAHAALAFALAHETGHHVQFLVHHGFGQATSTAVEMQADCYAGVWAHAEAAAHALTAPVFLDAASAELRRLSGRPDEVRTHGSAEQRIGALTLGLTSGDPAACDAPGLTWSPQG